MLRRQGAKVNHKKVYRLYREVDWPSALILEISGTPWSLPLPLRLETVDLKVTDMTR
ncbi:MAG: hypothetical protein COA29_02750 [Porticoccus sp.]|nr:MAG: hypothetical protein COA29_02750 [Porticoccus sp.]